MEWGFGCLKEKFPILLYEFPCARLPALLCACLIGVYASRVTVVFLRVHRYHRLSVGLIVKSLILVCNRSFRLRGPPQRLRHVE